MKRLNLLLAIGVAIVMVAAAFSYTAFERVNRHAASCRFEIGLVWPKDHGGVTADAPSGTCGFAFHALTQVQLSEGNRWHVLGVHPLEEGVDEDAYAGCGRWRLQVVAYGAGSVIVQNGPTTTFCTRHG